MKVNLPRLLNCDFWQQIAKMSTVSGAARFPNLTSIAKCVLALPVANADTEHIFSIVRKIVTITLRWSKILCALVLRKLNNDLKCYELETPKDLLSQACTATMEYNKAHGSKSN